MRTARLFTVSRSIPWGERAGGVCIQVGGWQTLPPWTEWLTGASENITLPQTSFAGGKKWMFEHEDRQQFSKTLQK